MKRLYWGVLVVAVLALVAGVAVVRKQKADGRSAPAATGESQGSSSGGAQQQQQPVVEIPEDRQQLIGVKTSEAAFRRLDRTIRTVGKIEYDERRTTTINAKFEGWIEKLHVDYTGRYVKQGEALAEFYSPELVATQQELINAIRWARQYGTGGAENRNETVNTMLRRDASSFIEAARKRLLLWDISPEQIKKVEESGVPIRTVTLYSPAAGFVVQKMAVKGMRVMPGEKLFDIVDMGSVWILADIYENELPLIRQGQQARLNLSYLPGREMISKVEYVYPSLSSETRTAKVRFSLANPGGQLKPQMFTNVEIMIPLGKRLVVPAEGVLDTGTRQIVYVDRGEGNFEPREVKTGLKTEGQVEITAGLKQGEKIASSALFLVDSEAQLKGVKPLAGGHQH